MCGQPDHRRRGAASGIACQGVCRHAAKAVITASNARSGGAEVRIVGDAASPVTIGVPRQPRRGAIEHAYVGYLTTAQPVSVQAAGEVGAAEIPNAVICRGSVGVAADDPSRDRVPRQTGVPPIQIHRCHVIAHAHPDVLPATPRHAFRRHHQTLVAAHTADAHTDHRHTPTSGTLAQECNRRRGRVETPGTTGPPALFPPSSTAAHHLTPVVPTTPTVITHLGPSPAPPPPSVPVHITNRFKPTAEPHTFCIQVAKPSHIVPDEIQ